VSAAADLLRRGTRLRPRPPASRMADRDVRGTPRDLYDGLNEEFLFTLDPCPLDESATAGAPLWGKDGLRLSWRGHRVFCNPPYSNIPPWLEKAREADVAVYLLPVRSDLRWWHEHAMRANEVRFVRGRLRFGGSGGAPFPSAVLVYRFGVVDAPRFASCDRAGRALGRAPAAGEGARP
jgi:phage N-6-adenine-methyltransferase